MIIWINGPFGVSKTQLAYELHGRLDNSFVFDPEEVGFLNKKIPAASGRGIYPNLASIAKHSLTLMLTLFVASQEE